MVNLRTIFMVGDILKCDYVNIKAKEHCTFYRTLYDCTVRFGSGFNLNFPKREFQGKKLSNLTVKQDNLERLIPKKLLALTYSTTTFIFSRVTTLPIHSIIACCVTLFLGAKLSYQHSQLLIFL